MLKIRMLRGMNVRSETSPLRQNKPQVNQKPLNPLGQDDNGRKNALQRHPRKVLGMPSPGPEIVAERHLEAERHVVAEQHKEAERHVVTERQVEAEQQL